MDPFLDEKKDKVAKQEKLLYSKGKKEKVIIDSLAKKDKAAHDELMAKEKSQKAKQHKKKKEAGKTVAAKAGLVFPVERIRLRLKSIIPAHSRVSKTSAVFMAAVLEYLVAELCELAGNRAKAPKHGDEDKDSKKRRARITPRFINFAIHEDGEFAELLKGVIMSGGGVVPLSDKKLEEQLRANKPKKMQTFVPEAGDDE